MTLCKHRVIATAMAMGRKICTQKNHYDSQLLGCSLDVLMEMGRGNTSEIP